MKHISYQLILQMLFTWLYYSGTDVTHLIEFNNVTQSSTTQQYFTFRKEQVIVLFIISWCECESKQYFINYRKKLPL